MSTSLHPPLKIDDNKLSDLMFRLKRRVQGGQHLNTSKSVKIYIMSTYGVWEGFSNFPLRCHSYFCCLNACFKHL